MRQWFCTQSGGAWNCHVVRPGRRLVWGAILLSSLAPSFARSDESPDIGTQIAAGEELFLREWTVGDKRSLAGDGLGPMYNAVSCVECHRLGGTGGGGANDENVDLLTVLAPRTGAGRQALIDRLSDFHPALVAGGRRSATTVLHRFSPDPRYEAWRQRTMTGDPPPNGEMAALAGLAVERRGTSATSSIKRLNGVGYQATQRNTPALFGAGLIDALPSGVFEELEARQAAQGEVSGRAPRSAQRKVGRFGWRGQTSTLHEFVLGACAVELGLQAPGHPQPIDPLAVMTSHEASQRPKPDDTLDISDAQCRALSEYVAHLPRPERIVPTDQAAAEMAARGEDRFAKIGCAACHVPQVAEIGGIYSDLLLHDMGKGLEDPVPANPSGRSNGSGTYYGGVDTLFATVAPELRREWRTPPLWGVRDSAPYLHDGRAQTVSDAIRWHEGEAAQSAREFRNLAKPAQDDVLFFLSCLVAPSGAPEPRPD